MKLTHAGQITIMEYTDVFLILNSQSLKTRLRRKVVFNAISKPRKG